MKFSEIYSNLHPVFSIELSPPRNSEEVAQIEAHLSDWAALSCPLVHVAYGTHPDGRCYALELTARLKHEYGKEVCNHLTCAEATAADIDRVLSCLQDREIDNIVALRGNPGKGQSSFRAPAGGYAHADELVRHVRRFGGFGIGVGGHPEKHTESPDINTDLLRLKGKVEAGADLLLTQFFYDNRYFYSFRRRCRSVGIEVPIVPSLLPVLSLEKTRRLACTYSVTIPPVLLRQLQNAEEDARQVDEIGIAHAVEQARDLLEHGVPGIHFHVLNRYHHIAEILARLNTVSDGSLPYHRG